MKIPSNIWTLLAGVVLTLVSFWYGQNHGLLPLAASEEADMIDGLFNAMMTIGTGLFLLVQGILIISAIRFRRRQGDTTDGPPVHGNIPLEILWTAIPAVIVLGISVYSFDIYNSIGGLAKTGNMGGHEMHQMHQAELAEQSPTTELASAALATGSDSKLLALGVGASPEQGDQPASLVVDVTALQFAWLFSYPDTGVMSGELHVPVGRDVRLNIVAQDVIHAFWVPEFRMKQDAIPGQTATLRFMPRTTGEYPLICAELCGAYHGAMKSQVIVQTPEEFETWMQSQVASQADQQATVAVNPSDLNSAERSPEDFLAPYVQEMGINPQVLENLQSYPEAAHKLETVLPHVEHS